MNRIKRYFSISDVVLWVLSVSAIAASYFLSGGTSLLILAASLVGATSLILNAKGNPVGQVLMIVFSLMYGVISYTFSYYGEMITYLGMTMPMAVVALISWFRNPFMGRRSEVTVNTLGVGEIVFMCVLTLLVTTVFYFILSSLGTANIVPSTLSVTTSFLAVYLTFRRSASYALAYAANDIVLVLLWTLASICDKKYISVVVCFAIFLINDIYGFISWRSMKQRQRMALREVR